MRFRLAIVTSAAWIMMVSGLPGQVWKKKDYSEWSKTDCKNLLQKSPWASEYMLAKVVIESIKAPSGQYGDPTSEGWDSAPHVTYRAQFWSAGPIRQAIVRMQQLDPKYKQLPAERKKAFDEESAKFLNATFPDTVLIQLSYTTIPAWSLPLSRFWQSKSQDELKQMFYLIGAPGRVAPLRITIQPGAAGGGTELQLVFPRRLNGVPLADPNLKQLALEIDHPAIDQITDAVRILIPFPVKKMILGDEVVY